MNGNCEKVLEEIKETYCNHLADNLVGIYVHGSIALGGFVWEKSDIDFLAVVKQGLTYEEKLSLMREVVKIHKRANPRGLEMSIVLEKYCGEPVFPTPFDLHFSGGTLDWYEKEPEQYCKNMMGEDSDLGGYMAVIRQSGVVLYGEPIDKVFGNVPESIYLESVMSDIIDAKEEYMKDVVYHTLNLCRTIAYMEDGIIRSKRDGGVWGRENLPEEFAGFIQTVLNTYLEGADNDIEWKHWDKKAQCFCEYAFERIGIE